MYDKLLFFSMVCCWVLALLLASAIAEHAYVLFDFAARDTDELSVRVGEALLITPHESGEEGWVHATRLRDSVSGLVPTSYVRSLDGPASASQLRVQVASTGGATLEATLEPAARSAGAENGAGHLDAHVSDALRRYRQRRAAYNSAFSADGRAQAVDVEAALAHWGVGISFSESTSGSSGGGGSDVSDGLLEHRSGVGGIPFFNLIELMDERLLATEIVGMLRAEWLSARATPPTGLRAALAAAAREDTRDVVLTFANLGYADFVVNGFDPAVVPHTLVIALDAESHRLFESAGVHSFYDGSMPTMASDQQAQGSASFMDMMKLRLLYLAEVLLLGYNALLTDADAVFLKDPLPLFDRDAWVSVACDATVVPKDWSEAPGMVMAGFFYARAGVRPIILLKEVLDYQARHPEQHDQQSFNQILSELYVADVSVSVMHPRLFPNGFQYFVKRTPQREGGVPQVVQNNWMMGADNKRHRFREAALWRRDPPAYYRGTHESPLRLLLYDGQQPAVSGLRRETSALRGALHLAELLNRTLVLPGFCNFTASSGLVPPPPLVYRDRSGALDRNVLDDAVDGDWCTVEWFYDMQAMQSTFGGRFRESSFVDRPSVPADALDTAGLPIFHIDGTPEWEILPAPEASTHLEPADVQRGATDAELLEWFGKHSRVPTLRLADLSGRIAAAGEDSSGTAAGARLRRGVAFREEITRHVQTQVEAAAPFDCLCLQQHGTQLVANISSLVGDFAQRVPPSRTVFAAGYRVDLLGLEPFRAVWDSVHALALYDWNGAGLQGRQFSSTINRLICRQAAHVHSWDARTQSSRECDHGSL